MNRFILASITVALVFACQPCLAQPATAAPQQKQRTGKQTPEQPRAGEQTQTAAPTPVPIENGVVNLKPENTKVEFIGTHVGEPNPRLGGFGKFAGQLKMADDGKSISSVAVEFKTASVWTTIPDLTNHLKNADFLNVDVHPSAKFQSTKIVPGETPGLVNVTGNFSLLGETKEISFPAKVKIDGSGVLLKSEFEIDRTQFGMSKMVEKVSPAVSLKVSVGEKTKGAAASQGQGRRGSGRMDPAQFFARMDADGDGKLSGDEIPNRMKERLEQMDTDGDEAISLEEMQEMIKRRRGGGGGQ